MEVYMGKCCDEKCTCGCQEGNECTCNCDENCACGCNKKEE